VAISDIVSDRTVPEALKQDPELWSGCVSGAFQEFEFVRAFAAAGFENICFDKRDAQPWRVVQDIEFRPVTLTACKPPRAAAAAADRRLMYRGPFAAVIDDSGRSWPRGMPQPASAQRAAALLHPVCGNAFIDLDSLQRPELPVAAQGCCSPGDHGGCC